MVRDEVVHRPFKQATTPGNVAASIFWLKARAGWREKHPDPPPGADRDDPTRITVTIRHMADPKMGTYEEGPWNPPVLEGRIRDA